MPDAADRMSAPRVLHLAQSDSEGGANKAAFRLHKTLLSLGVPSKFHAGRILRNDVTSAPARAMSMEATRVAAFVNALPLKLYPNRRRMAPFSPSVLSYGRVDQKLLAEAEIICTHWIAGGFLRPSQLAQLGKPIIWRLSDLWPFTGGCHYPGECRGFIKACGTCPILGSARDVDLSRFGFRQRERAYANVNLTIVAPSRWIAEEACRSHLFANRRIEHIPTGVDLSVFQPRDRTAARSRFGLPEQSAVVLFGALGALDDPRKGFPAFVECIERLKAPCPGDVAVAVFGGGNSEAPRVIGEVPVHNLGRIDSEEALASLYSAADVLVAPFGDDNLPNVVLEALACAVPVVAFAVGGIPDAIVSEENGFLAPKGNIEVLALQVTSILSNAGLQGALRQGARRMAEKRFDLRGCASAYLRLFEELAKRPERALYSPFE